MTTPTFLVRPVARPDALEDTTYSSSRAAARTRCLVASETWPLPLRARDTVAVDTPASWATSLIPGIDQTFLGRGRSYSSCAHRFRALVTKRPANLYPCSAPSVR